MNVLTLASDMDQIIPLVAIVGGLGIAVVGMVMGTIRRTVQTKEREQSRRELAAYVAEGSMTADDAYKIMSADPKGKGEGGKSCCS